MKVKKGFVMRQVADVCVLVATGEAAAWFHGFVELNASGAILWQLLENGADEAALVQALLDRYETGRERAAEDVAAFISTLREASILE